MKKSYLKTINTYGVQMTSIENMLFSKYLNNQGIAMNTKTEKERKEIAINWLVMSQKTEINQVNNQ